jgi:hypothetical protein
MLKQMKIGLENANVIPHTIKTVENLLNAETGLQISIVKLT